MRISVWRNARHCQRLTALIRRTCIVIRRQITRWEVKRSVFVRALVVSVGHRIVIGLANGDVNRARCTLRVGRAVAGPVVTYLILKASRPVIVSVGHVRHRAGTQRNSTVRACGRCHAGYRQRLTAFISGAGAVIRG